MTVAAVLASDGVEPAEATPVRRRLRDPRPALALLIGNLAARFERPQRDADPEIEVEEAPELVASETPDPVRPTAVAARAEVRHESRAGLAPAEEETQVRSDLPTEPETEVAAPIEAYAGHPAAEPVIGPQFAGARRRLGLTVDQLAERTRIRPHVIEAIEVDDFARAAATSTHAATCARWRGCSASTSRRCWRPTTSTTPTPRSTRAGSSRPSSPDAGPIRGTRGGPNWSVLVAAVMALVLCWSVARLVTGGPAHVDDQAVLSGSGGPNQPRPRRPSRSPWSSPPPAVARTSWCATASATSSSPASSPSASSTPPGVPAGPGPVHRRGGTGRGGGPEPRAHGARGSAGLRVVRRTAVRWLSQATNPSGWRRGGILDVDDHAH